ncbi:hypothetical protein [Acinetobacter tandoii]|uniref:Uncharacterized protein n=1 Tax=Acinetobacter tandoii DSM 14970 = CIP 107469 TaxID=1120927 RepID=R9ASL5_9GAMM|nr:hypothetical protein [Acinetobacter tandoii]EOR05055.1 hypothetical protein I593_03139 [Acinetobacter tandoii DSM 14970 = CIP 107469]
MKKDEMKFKVKLEQARAEQLLALSQIVVTESYKNPSVKRSVDDAIRRLSEECGK